MRTDDANWELIAQHGEFVQRLARSLVEDASRADDLVQQAWLAFLARPPQTPGRIRAWLAGVVRNTARHERRSGERRRRRELQADRRRQLERKDNPQRVDELREREDLLGAVTDAVRALDERYRRVVLLRFYENLKPREIAARLEIPVETVRTRIRRALEQIAVRLDHRFDDERSSGSKRRTWALALIPLCGHSAGASTAAHLGASSLAAKGSIALVASAVIAAGVWFAWPDQESTPNSVVGAGDPPAVATGAEGASEPAPSPGVADTPAVGGAVPPPIEESPPAVALRVGGVVIDSLTLSPVGDAEVRLVESPRSGGPAEIVATARSDSEGRFRFPPREKKESDISVEVEREGYLPVTDSHRKRIEDDQDVTVRLSPGARVTGEVVYARDGSPVEGGRGHMIARLMASAFSESPQGLRAARYMSRDFVSFEIDEWGRFSVDTLEPLVAFEVIGPGYGAAFSAPVKPKAGEVSHVVIRVHSGASLKGVVRGPAGEPIRGAKVTIYPAIEDRYPDHLYYNHHLEPEATTDEDGQFEIANASRLYRSISVSHPEWPRWSKHSELVPAEDFVEVELAPSHRVVGRLRPEVGESEPSERDSRFAEGTKGELRFERKRVSVEIDTDGAFRSAAIPDGVSRAVLEVDGWVDVELDWTEHDANSISGAAIDVGEVSIERGEELEIVVRDAASRELLEGAQVQIFAPRGEVERGRKVDEGRTDEEGRAELGGFVSENLVVEVHRFRYAATTVEIEPDAAARTDKGSIEVALAPGGEIGGRVVDDSGLPVVGARVTVSGSPPVTRRTARSSVDGRFRFVGVEAGVEIQISVSGEYRVTHTEKLAPLDVGATVELENDIVLTRGGAIVGRVVDSGGRGVEGALVSALNSASMRSGAPLGSWAETDAAGDYRIAGLAGGYYHVSAAYRGHRINRTATLSREPEAAVGFEAELTLQLKDLGRGTTWSAVVRGPDGDPLRSASVYYGNARTVTDHQGRFICFDLPESGTLSFELDRFLPRDIAYASIEDLEPVVHLEPGAQLEFRVEVVGNERTRPSALRVKLRGHEKQRGRSTGISIDRFGVGRLYALEEGEWTVEASADGFPRPDPATVTLRSGEVGVLEVRLQP